MNSPATIERPAVHDNNLPETVVFDDRELEMDILWEAEDQELPLWSYE